MKKFNIKVWQPNLRLQKTVNKTLSRHLALVNGQSSTLLTPYCGVVQEAVGLPASLLSLTWRCITTSLATQLMLVTITAPETPVLTDKQWMNMNFEVDLYGKVTRHLLLLSQWAHARLLPKEETGPPVTRILLWQPCRNIRTFLGIFVINQGHSSSFRFTAFHLSTQLFQSTCKKHNFFVPGWCGMTSPLYSELPQELLLDVEPMRPALAWRHTRIQA